MTLALAMRQCWRACVVGAPSRSVDDRPTATVHNRAVIIPCAAHAHLLSVLLETCRICSHGIDVDTRDVAVVSVGVGVVGVHDDSRRQLSLELSALLCACTQTCSQMKLNNTEIAQVRARARALRAAPAVVDAHDHDARRMPCARDLTWPAQPAHTVTSLPSTTPRHTHTHTHTRTLSHLNALAFARSCTLGIVALCAQCVKCGAMCRLEYALQACGYDTDDTSQTHFALGQRRRVVCNHVETLGTHRLKRSHLTHIASAHDDIHAAHARTS
jgi:hypothetical protein